MAFLMALPPRISGLGVAENLNVEAKWSQGYLSEKFRAITAEQIKIIVDKFVETVVNRLDKCSTIMELPEAGSDEEQFEDLIENIEFVEQRLRKATFAFFRSKLECSFSIPEIFLEQGLNVIVGDDAPFGFITYIEKQTGIKLNKEDFPASYQVSLGLDNNRSQQSVLFFLLKEFSNKEEFPTQQKIALKC